MDALASTLTWLKASFSVNNGNCVELAAMSDRCMAVRDSKDPQGPILQFTHDEWSAFVTGVKAGEFDQLAE